MSVLKWGRPGERRYETGVSKGVLYIPDAFGVYNTGFAWNGLTGVTESPSGAESNKQYADNQVYLNLRSAEEFGGTIEAFTAPDEFAQCDGTSTPTPGVMVGQQNRKTFGLSYQTKIGTDQDQNAGYKIHMVWGATASPSEKAYTTINESPEAITLSWEFDTLPVETPGFDKPVASITIDSTKVSASALTTLENFLYGTAGTDPSLPTPEAVVAIFSGTSTPVTPTMPTYNATTDTITIPTVTGVEYRIDGEVVTGGVVITANTIVTANPLVGYHFPAGVDDDWLIVFS